MSKHLVLRTFPSAVPLQRGCVYDTTRWRNTERLVRQRYLQLVSDDTPLGVFIRADVGEQADVSALAVVAASAPSVTEAESTTQTDKRPRRSHK